MRCQQVGRVESRSKMKQMQLVVEAALRWVISGDQLCIGLKGQRSGGKGRNKM